MLLPKAKSLIASLDAAIFDVSSLTSHVQDTITLSCIPTAVFYFCLALSFNLISAIRISKYEFMNKV